MSLETEIYLRYPMIGERRKKKFRDQLDRTCPKVWDNRKSKRPISNQKDLVSMKNIRDKNHEYLISIDYTHCFSFNKPSGFSHLRLNNGDSNQLRDI
jgi:hypothetical protein